jgi:hypothetical protein
MIRLRAEKEKPLHTGGVLTFKTIELIAKRKKPCSRWDRGFGFVGLE